MRRLAIISILIVCIVALGCGGGDKPARQAQGQGEKQGGATPVEPGQAVITASGLSIQDLVVGTGATAERGKTDGRQTNTARE